MTDPKQASAHSERVSGIPPTVTPHCYLTRKLFDISFQLRGLLVGPDCYFMHKHVKNNKDSKVSKNKSSSKTKLVARPSFHGVNLQGALAAIKKLKAADIKSNYFDIKTGQLVKSDDDKILTVQLDALKSAARSMMGHQRARMWLWQDPFTYNGSAATALAVASGLTPANASEWSSVIALYDEIKVHAIHGRIVTIYTAGTSVNMPIAVASYDSTRNTTPTSVADCCESPQHHIWTLPVVAGSIQPTIATSDGFQHFKIKIPSQAVANAAAVTGGTGIVANFPGEWMSTLDTADSVGYFRCYIEALTGSSVLSLKVLWGFDCEFRERT